jgi:O-antigen ligase
LSLWTGSQRILLLGQQGNTFRIRVAFFGLALLLGIVLGGLLLFVPPLYILIGIGGLIYAYLLLFKIEVAVILALLLRNWLGQFNYLGGETALHPNGVMGIAIIGGALFFFLFNRIDYSRLPVFKPFLGFVLVCFISLALARDELLAGLTVTLRLATALAIYAVLLYKLDSMKKVKWVIAAIVTAQVWLTINALLGYAPGGSVESSGTEIARLGHSGVGVYLALISILCLVFLLDARTNPSRLLWGGLTGLFGVALFLSYGRAAWIGFLVGVVFVGLMKHRKLLVFLPLLLILAMVVAPSVFQRFTEIDLSNLDDWNSGTFASRLQLWQASLQVYTTRPLLGVGFGIERYRVGEYLGRYEWMIHSDYVSILVGTGLVGFLLFVFWQGQWLAELLKVYRGAELEYEKTIALAVLAIFVSSLVFRITDNVVQTTEKFYPLCALIAVALALPRIRAEEQARKSDLTLSQGHRYD